MKIKTVPLLPLSELSECSFPSTSGNLKSSIIVPMAGGAGRSFELRPLPATAANPMTTRDARKIGRPYFFMLEKLLSKMIGFVNAKISSQKLDVASGRSLPQGQIDGRKLLSQKPDRERGCRTLLLRSRSFAPSLTVGFLPVFRRKPERERGCRTLLLRSRFFAPSLTVGFLPALGAAKIHARRRASSEIIMTANIPVVTAAESKQY